MPEHAAPLAERGRLALVAVIALVGGLVLGTLAIAVLGLGRRRA